MNFEEMAEKFRLCADFANWPADKLKQIVEFVHALEDAGDMRKPAAPCSA